MMEDLKLGQIIKVPRQRDAIHIAVAPVMAAEALKAGAHVGVENGGAFSSASPVGIVDPFLKQGVKKGEQFWLFLYPNTITSLRHEWAHPAFGGYVDEKAESKAWLESFAGELDQSYDRLMHAADTWVFGHDWTYDNTETYKDVDYAKWPIFWKHYEIVTGRKVDDHEATFFTCSC